MLIQKVFIITVAVRREDGEYDKHINDVYSTKEAARTELKVIKDGNNRDEEHLKNWRAKTPIGQLDDLSLEFFENGFWTCRNFYSISEHIIK